MEHFSTTELVELSAVNKQWNYEARSLMKSRSNLIARLTRNDACQVLQKLASDLQKMRQAELFSGMTIQLADVHQRRNCRKSSSKELAQLFKNILNPVRWKNLSLTFYSGWEQHKRCPPFRLVKKILKNYSAGLEELSLRLESRERQNIEQVFQNCSFPSLKTLRLLNSQQTFIPEALSSNWIKALVSVAPNLQVLYTKDYVDLSANLLEGSSAIHVTNYPFYVQYDQIPESLIGQLRMQRLELSHLMRDFNQERFTRLTSAVLESSRTTLSWMRVDTMFLIPLTLFGVTLENLKDLEISLHYSHLRDLQPHIWRLIKSFDFTRIFPNLDTISIISTTSDHESLAEMANALNDMVDHGNPAFEFGPDRAKNIRNLRLKRQALLQLYPSVPFLSQMFPNIEKLSIITPEIPLAGIWNGWLDLKELEVTISCSRILQLMELDCALCGLFPEEIALLRKKNEKYLKAVNIVPVMPSIVCFRGLRIFKLVCDVRSPISCYDPSYLLSKVTGLIAFQRCPGLAVTVSTSNPKLVQALSQIKPYALVTSV